MMNCGFVQLSRLRKIRHRCLIPTKLKGHFECYHSGIWKLVLKHFTKHES